MGRKTDSIGRSFIYATALVCLLLVAAACGSESAPQPGESDMKAADSEPAVRTPASGPALSEMARSGEELFNVSCSACHGPGAAGTNLGPPLIDRVYHPGHHPDFSIRNAVSNGVKQHHWWFGDMPPVAGVPPEDVEKLVCYIREVQRSNGIFEGDAFSTVC